MNTPRIPYPTERAQSRGIDKQQWGVLIGTTFANTMNGDSILQAWDLAKMRGLDVFGGHVAIVKQSRYDRTAGGYVDYEVCWLTVKALIFLAHKTDSFAGIDEVKFGTVRSRTFEGSKRNQRRPEPSCFRNSRSSRLRYGDGLPFRQRRALCVHRYCLFR